MIRMSIPGQMTQGELECLEELARSTPENAVIVETGSLYGRSSYTWATSASTGTTVYCIDPWVREQWIIDLVETQQPGCPEFSFEAFQRYTKDCENIIPIKGYSPQDVKTWDKSVDIFFDDSLHHNPYFRINLRFWLQHMKSGGIMCGHDYCSEWPDVVKEVDALAAELGVPVHTTEWIWWFKVPSRRNKIVEYFRRMRTSK